MKRVLTGSLAILLRYSCRLIRKIKFFVSEMDDRIRLIYLQIGIGVRITMGQINGVLVVRKVDVECQCVLFLFIVPIFFCLFQELHYSFHCLYFKNFSRYISLTMSRSCSSKYFHRTASIQSDVTTRLSLSTLVDVDPRCISCPLCTCLLSITCEITLLF